MAVAAAAAAAAAAAPSPPPPPPVAAVDELRAAICAACWGEDQLDDEGCIVHRFSFERGEAEGIFEDVGGAGLWVELNQALKQHLKV